MTTLRHVLTDRQRIQAYARGQAVLNQSTSQTKDIAFAMTPGQFAERTGTISDYDLSANNFHGTRVNSPSSVVLDHPQYPAEIQDPLTPRVVVLWDEVGASDEQIKRVLGR